MLKIKILTHLKNVLFRVCQSITPLGLNENSGLTVLELSTKLNEAHNKPDNEFDNNFQFSSILTVSGLNQAQTSAPGAASTTG